MNLCAKEHGTEFFERFDNGKQFFFHCGAILLCFVEFARAECTRETVLFDDCTWLEVGGNRFHVKWLVVIRLDQQCVGLCECFHLIESFGVFVFPLEGSGSLEQICERNKCV